MYTYQKPIWLALYDNFYDKYTEFDNNDHIDFYKEIFNEINDFEIFEKILVVFKNNNVVEF